MGIHYSAAESIAEYIKAAGFESGPLFRPRLSAFTDELAPRRMTQRSMFRLLMGISNGFPAQCGRRCCLTGKRVLNASIRSTRCAQLQRHCCWIRAFL
jgi:hypothetical protein